MVNIQSMQVFHEMSKNWICKIKTGMAGDILKKKNENCSRNQQWRLLFLFYCFYRGRQWKTAQLILCLHWAACANALQNKSRLAAILFLCHANLLCFDARIWPHFHMKSHKSPLFNTQIGMLTALFNL